MTPEQKEITEAIQRLLKEKAVVHSGPLHTLFTPEQKFYTVDKYPWSIFFLLPKEKPRENTLDLKFKVYATDDKELWEKGFYTVRMIGDCLIEGVRLSSPRDLPLYVNKKFMAPEFLDAIKNFQA